MNTEGNNEQQTLTGKQKVEEPLKTVPFMQLLRYATPSDKFLMVVGSIAAFANGSAFPLFSLIFGNMTDSFGPNSSADDVLDKAGTQAIWFIVVGLGTMLMSFIMFSTWMVSGERQAIQFRKNYFKAIIRQEIGWFDTINPNTLSTKVANETFSIQGAIGEKVPTFIMTFSMTFFGFVIGYTRGWQLALVITCSLPAMSIAAAIMTMVMQSQQARTNNAYSSAGALAEQAINAIKTVKMLGGEDFECENYTKWLKDAARTSIRFGFLSGFSMGFVWGVMLMAYALAFWYGSRLISNQTWNDNVGRTYSAGDVLVIFFAILTGGFSLGQAGPCLQNFAKGKQDAVKIFEIIDRVPRVLSSPNPKIIQNLKGEIILKDVSFTYPNRPNVEVLHKINIHVHAGQKIALVGQSGCGKSTIMQLIERFYDADQGSLSIDDVDVKDMTLDYLRENIGYVGQEPVLFATSIRENLLYGKKDATESELIQVLKEVNAWDFIQRMDKGLDTYVGIGGGQLSGGQKQRIAIARAILKRPKILLLDEATSALDRTNELLIQNTLDQVSKGITTLVIAHRLNTIQNADLIYVLDQGQVIEVGTHQELMNARGKYEIMAKNQLTIQDKGEDDDVQEKAQKGNKYDKSSPSKTDHSSPLLEDYIPDEGTPRYTVRDPKNYLIPTQTLIVPLVIEQAKQLKEAYDNQSAYQPLIIVREQASQVNVYDPNQVELQFKDNKISKEETEQEKKDRLKTEKQEESKVTKRLFAYNKEERPYFYFGLLAAAANGTVFPIFSLFLSRMIEVLSQSDPRAFPIDERASKQVEVSDKASMLALWFLIMALCAIILWTIQISFMTVVGERLTLKVRRDTFQKLLRMPISFHDIPKNNAGTLTSRLSVDAKLINGLTSSIIGINVMNISSLITGMVIAFNASWQLTLVSLALSPLVFLGGALQAQFMQGFSDQSDSAYKDSGNLIMEAVCNIRTVQSFGNQDVILNLYSVKVQEPLKRAQKKGVMSGFAFGFSQMQMFLIYAVVFYVGAVLHKYQGLSVLNMFTSIFGIIFATMGAGNNQHFAGDIGVAKNAGKNLIQILDGKDEFQIEEERKTKRIRQEFKGDIELRNVYFKYENREKHLFEGFNLSISHGNKVSFVGPSGCGKSTIMQLLLRFYEPQRGEIFIDGINILDYDLRFLRSQFGIVSQEPVLFNGTIKENIIYNSKDITMEQVKNAAEQANAIQFISDNQYDESGNKTEDFGAGFDRKVGPRGAQISGGQKQRIAIARAVLRNSNILLLDEATSALDASSEQLVQESLNRLMENKTSIVIAHRISTIKDSRTIFVFSEGIIVESGTYSELIAKRGYFYRLEQGIVH